MRETCADIACKREVAPDNEVNGDRGDEFRERFTPAHCIPPMSGILSGWILLEKQVQLRRAVYFCGRLLLPFAYTAPTLGYCRAS